MAVAKQARQLARPDAARLESGSLGAAVARLPGTTERALPVTDQHRWAAALCHPLPARRILALEVLCRFSGDHALELVMGMLSDPDPSVRCAAVSAAEHSRAHRLISCLIVSLDDPETAVRSASRRALEVISQRPIDARAVHDPARRERVIAELRDWWKRERLVELLTQQ